MTESRKRAKRLLSFYFDEAGVITHGDNQVEVEAIVDNIIDAAVEETLRKIQEEKKHAN